MNSKLCLADNLVIFLPIGCRGKWGDTLTGFSG